MADRGEPPKKKGSRFFSAGKSLIGSLPGRSRKPSDNAHHPSPLETEADDADEETPAASSQLTTGPLANVSFRPTKGRHVDNNNNLAEDEDEDEYSHTNDTALEEGDDAEDNEPRPSKGTGKATITGRLSSAASALQRLAVRDTRRDGIYGSDALQRAASNTHTAAGSRGILRAPSPYHVPPQPIPRPFAGVDPFGPPGYRAQAALTPSSQPHPIPPVANSYPFNFPLPPTVQHQQQRHPALFHQDSGPLGQHRLAAALPKGPGPGPGPGPVETNPRHKQPFLPRPAPRTTLDLDRDPRGRRLPHPPPLQPIPNLPYAHHSITSLPRHSTHTPSHRQLPAQHTPRVPANLYTSPNRIPNALAFSRKRKRSLLPTLPPPAYTYTRTNDPNFNIFGGVLLYPELCFHLARELPLADLISLYAISRDYHTIIDTRFTTVILSQSLRKAPESSRAFPFRCYAHLCRHDPASRIPHPDPRKAGADPPIVRSIPSFRWLQLVLHREKIVHDITFSMAAAGLPLPARCALALKRMWFMMDIPDNARRIGFIHNRNLITDLDLYFMMCFFVKLDMRFNDPVGGEKRDGVRKMVLGARTLSTLARVLRRGEWRDEWEMLNVWLRMRYELDLPDDGGDAVKTVCGIPVAELGKARYEYWGLRTPEQLGRQPHLLLRPDQLVMREAVRRGLRFHKHFLRCLTYGYIRPDNLEDYAPRLIRRRIDGLEGEEYGIDDELGGAMCPSLGEERGMLDLGMREDEEVSSLCVNLESLRMGGMSTRQREKEVQRKQFVETCMAWSSAEREGVEVMETD